MNNITANQAGQLKDFAFTYKRNVSPRDDVTREMYDEILRHIVEKGGIIRFVYYELDTHGHFHIHGTAQFPDNIGYRTLAYKGYTSRWRQIYDLAGWETYCKKDIDEHLEDIQSLDGKPLTHSLFNIHPITI